jgi:threonine dehydrogenase-like Zn-dependent dehydrogenase
MTGPALEYRRSPARYLTGRALPRALATHAPPLRLVDRPEPARPGPGWVRLRPLLSGICGSDLSMLSGRTSPYLSAVVSPPFVPGHEVVAQTLDDLPGLPKGTRVVVDPVLSCAPRRVAPCRWCALGMPGRCDHVTTGRLAAGLQTGFCADTGGGWGRAMVAHESQLHAVPDGLATERAVLVEPLACAIHAVRRVAIPPAATVVVVGAGTVGLLTLLALHRFTSAGPVYLVAKHGHQRRRAEELGVTEVFEPDRAVRAIRRAAGGVLERPVLGPEFLLGGADVGFECTGTRAGLDLALRTVRAGGTVVLSGMPAGPVDLTPVWFRELRLVGSYASDGRHATGDEPDFTAALALAGQAPLDGYVDAVYPLYRWREALGHAAAAGRLGSVKVAFDPTRN